MHDYYYRYKRRKPDLDMRNMVGPKRGIEMMDYALIEFDMRIKADEQEEDDLQLVDGASSIDPGGLWNGLSTIRITGDCGAIHHVLKLQLRRR